MQRTWARGQVRGVSFTLLFCAVASAQTRSSGFAAQSGDGNDARFEVLRLRRGGGLDAQSRDNGAPWRPWSLPSVAFGSHGDITHAALAVVLEAGTPRLEVVGVEGGALFHQWREPSGRQRWQTRTALPDSNGVNGAPGFVQVSRGEVRERHVVAPLVSGGMGHWIHRAGPDAGWKGPVRFGEGEVLDVTLIQSSLGEHGSLALVARVGDALVFYSNDSHDPAQWSPGERIDSGVRGSPALIQSNLGGRERLELVAPLERGGLGHWRRKLDGSDRPWDGPQRIGRTTFDAASLVQGHFDGGLRLHVVGRAGLEYAHYWREQGGWWTGPRTLPAAPMLPPRLGGQSDALVDAGFVGIHTSLLPTGSLLLFGNPDPFAPGTGRVFDWVTGVSEPTADNPHVFCSGHSFFPDGRLVVVGGHGGAIRDVRSFDARSRKWTLEATMPRGRWYPGVVSLPDGRVLMMSGTQGSGAISPTNPVNPTLQWIDPRGSLSPEHPLPSPFSALFPPNIPTVDLYPFLHVLPSGKVLVHSRQTTRFYDPATNSWDTRELYGVSKATRSWPLSGSSVLLPLDPEDAPPYRARILIAGGSTSEPEDPSTQTVDTPATATAEILDTSLPEPAWRPTASMHFPRVLSQAVLLPNGTVLVLGGSLRGRDTTAVDPVLVPELFDPETETWTALNPLSVPRLYHSTAVLLPDGRVMTAGKDGTYVPHPFHYPEHRVEYFRPPVLLQGPRPVLTEAPATLRYAQRARIRTPDAARTKAVLLRLGSATHGLDTSQRLVRLVVASRGTDVLDVYAPPDANIAPPGHYMLFLVDAHGVYSEARIVVLE